MPIVFSQDDFLAASRALMDAAVADYQAALAAHAATVGTPAPTALTPVVDAIVQGDGTYTVVVDTSIGAQLEMVERKLSIINRLSAAEGSLGIVPLQGAALADRLAAVQAAAVKIA
jgi:hypothetical protein